MSCAHPFEIPNPLYKSKHYTMFGYKKYIQIPCGWCLNCRVDKRNFLEDCAEQEYKDFRYGAFVTLTYDNNHIQDKLLNIDGELYSTLSKSDVQHFIYRLRSKVRYLADIKGLNTPLVRKDFKYIIVGEYGENGQIFDRCHYHCLFFGLDYKACEDLFLSCWQGGIIESDPILNGGIRYVLKYLDKQQHGKEAESMYDDKGLERPFMVHSPYFGISLITKNLDYIKTHNFTYLGKHNKPRPISSYWKNKLLGRVMPDYDNLRRQMKSYNIKADCKDSSVSTYSLKQINEFRHSQALKREEQLVIQCRQNGIGVYTPPPITLSFNELQTIKKLSDIALLETIPF